MTGRILVLNCGSSSIKFALFDIGATAVPRRPSWQGAVEAIGTPQSCWRDSDAPDAAPRPGLSYHAALGAIGERIEARLDGGFADVVAHRVVHGGSRFLAPVRVDAGVLAELAAYVPLAPLHQPFALEAVDALLRRHPDVPQVACFDTAFHRTLPIVEQLLPLPWSAWERGVRRYGFHGLSYEYVSLALRERYGDRAAGRTLVAHLGSGASLCAMRDGASVATTMGFSALDGLMMGTRCGAVDPGAILYLMQADTLSPDAMSQLLYRESGLLGVSGTSSDPRELLALEDRTDETGERIRLALDAYVRRIVREVGALAAVLGGLDLLAFTAGIGEHNAEIRRRVCRDLAWLGVCLDESANARNAPTISAERSSVLVAVEPTNEEWMAASHAMAIIRVPPAVPGRSAAG